MPFVQLKVMDYKRLKLGYYFLTECLHQGYKVLNVLLLLFWGVGFFFFYAYFFVIPSTEEMLSLERVT